MDTLVHSYETKISTAKVAKDPAAVTALSAEKKARTREWSAANNPAIAALIPDIDEIADNNPGMAAWVIKSVLTEKNRDVETGTVATIFAQNDADKALAAKLSNIGNRTHAYFYYSFYADASEIDTLPGSPMPALAAAVVRRASALDALGTLVPAYYRRSLGLGLVTNHYNSWFNALYRATWKTDRPAALTLLQNEQNGIASLDSKLKNKITEKRVEELRLLAARAAEIIAQGK